MDAIPVASQVKSFVQFAAGDKEGAKTTQERFSQQCIGVSQVRSIVELAKGDKEGAKTTQKTFLSGVSNTINGIPVIGHVKGGIHYAMKDKEKGHAAMKAASRTTGVVVGGAAGLVVAGPLGAVAGGVAGGTGMETVITAADSLRHQEFRPYGNFGLIQDPKNPGKWVDAVGSVALDGISGVAAGSMATDVAPVIHHRFDFTPDYPGAPPPSWKTHTANAIADTVVPKDPVSAALATQPADEVDKLKKEKVCQPKKKLCRQTYTSDSINEGSSTFYLPPEVPSKNNEVLS